MQRNGLERGKGVIVEGSRDLTGHALLPDSHEHRRIPAFRRILLVANGLGSVPAAFRTACALADPTEGEVVLLEAASRLRGIPTSAGQADWTNQASNVDLLEIRRPSLNAASIDQVAQEYACDLVMLGMESQTNELRMMTENVAEETFRRVSCPTLIIGPKATCFPSADSAAGSILFATSFHDRNMVAVSVASRVANLCGGRPFDCVHVLPANLAAPTHERHIIPQILRDALLEGAKQNHVMIKPEQCHILYGRSVSDAVVKFAALRKACLIVLGVQQSGPVVSYLPEGKASSVILFAPCPVLMLASPRQRDVH
jgi:nucleotide-binding universal stress UspA family protein